MMSINLGFCLRLALLLVPAWLVLASTASAKWEEYQYETFDSTETIFPTGTFGEASYSVDSEGRYIVNGMDSSVDSLAAINDSNSFYRVSADCQILSSTAGELAFCGLIFHYGKRPGDDKVSYYVFYVYGDGFYGVKRIINAGKSDVIIPLAQTELLAGGELNTLAVEARGNRFELFINGQPVSDFSDIKLDGGGYGLYISKHSIGAFDNFEVQLEPAPVRPQEDVQRSEGGGGIKPLSIPRNPDRPLYPWEVGYDKDPKKKKRRIEQGDSAKSAPQESKRTAPPKRTAKPTNELKRDPASRSSKGFIADAAANVKEEVVPESSGGTSLREQYRQSHDTLPEPKSEDPDAALAADPIETQRTTAPDDALAPPSAVELEDDTITDTGSVLPDEDKQSEDILYRRDPKFEQPEEASQKQADAEPAKVAENQTDPSKRRNGLSITGDDWDTGTRTAYIPKKRLPKAAPPKESTKPATEPIETTASDGSKLRVETVPLDEEPLADPDLETADVDNSAPPESAPESFDEAQAPLDTTDSLLSEPAQDMDAGLDSGVEAVSASPTVELPDLPIESPEAPETAAIPKVAPGSAVQPGRVAISDDFTAQQRWNAQELPTSSYRYVDSGYAIDNTKAQTMAISYQQDKFKDLSLAVDAKHTAGADYVGYGLAARFRVGSDASGRTVISYYGLFISLSGEFMLLKVVDGQETVLKDWGLSPLIKLGENNRIELKVEGNQITAMLNGREAARVVDSDISSGGYALLAGPGISAHYDNLLLTGSRE